MLKWESGAEVKQAQERMNRFFARINSSRVLYVLMMLAAFVVLSGAADKWTGG